MTRMHRSLAIAGVFSVLLLGATALTTPARAGDDQSDIKLVWVEHEDDGSDTQLWQDQTDGHFFCIFVYPDGYSFTYDPTNPNPNDEATGKGSHSDKPDVVALIESGAARIAAHLPPGQSAALMSHLEVVLAGGGLAPHYNPSDDDSGTGPGAAPVHSMAVKKTPQEIRQQIEAANEVANELATLDGAMGDGDEGGSESSTGFNKNGAPGGTGNDDGDYTEGQNKTVGQTEKDLLGPKPQYVNPPHYNGDNGGSSRGGGARGVSGGSGGGRAGATATH